MKDDLGNFTIKGLDFVMESLNKIITDSFAYMVANMYGNLKKIMSNESLDHIDEYIYVSSKSAPKKYDKAHIRIKHNDNKTEISLLVNEAKRENGEHKTFGCSLIIKPQHNKASDKLNVSIHSLDKKDIKPLVSFSIIDANDPGNVKASDIDIQEKYDLVYMLDIIKSLHAFVGGVIRIYLIQEDDFITKLKEKEDK